MECWTKKDCSTASLPALLDTETCIREGTERPSAQRPQRGLISPTQFGTRHGCSNPQHSRLSINSALTSRGSHLAALRRCLARARLAKSQGRQARCHRRSPKKRDMWVEERDGETLLAHDRCLAAVRCGLLVRPANRRTNQPTRPTPD